MMKAFLSVILDMVTDNKNPMIRKPRKSYFLPGGGEAHNFTSNLMINR